MPHASTSPIATDLVNVSDIVESVAKCHSDKLAVIEQRLFDGCAGRFEVGPPLNGCITFGQLVTEINCYAWGLSKQGLRPGTRVILMVKPSIEFFVLTFALFKIGAVPVLIDPGMGRKQLIRCLEEIEAEAFIGIPLAHVARLLFSKSFRSVKTCVTVGRRWFWGGLSLKEVRFESTDSFNAPQVRADDLAAILFTSGSTGPAKGVAYEHGVFAAQVRYLSSQFGCGGADTDVATFPLFALFDVALGMTAIIPNMNPSKPAEVEPQRIVSAIENHAATQIFGSPALLNRVVAYCESSGIKLESLRRVLTAGAPIPPALLGRLRAVLHDDVNIYTPYGATESLPVACIESREIIGETAKLTASGAGICVGKVMPEMALRIVEITDQPISGWASCKILGEGEIGEICVRGPVVTKEYFRKPDATKLAKITEGDTVWHRMGDVGYLDDAGRLWFCGRKAHRVQTEAGTLYSIPCESIFNAHPQVFRSALVGVGNAPRQKPVLCVETMPGVTVEESRLVAALLTLGQEHMMTRSIEAVLFHPGFPVDVRHNAKINRERLALWAGKQLR